jgi:hypothetical protein
MCKLTLRKIACSMWTGVLRVGCSDMNSGELHRKGTWKLQRPRASPDAWLHSCDLADEALLLDLTMDSGVDYNDGLPEMLRRGCSVIVKDIETVIEIQRVYRVRVFMVILQEVL